MVLEFAEPSAIRLLDLLDGSRTEDEIISNATSRLGLDRGCVVEIMCELRDTGLLLDSRALLPEGLTESARERLLVEAAALLAEASRGRRRAGLPRVAPARSGSDEPAIRPNPNSPATALLRRSVAKVLVTGSESLVAPIAIALAAAGIGQVDPVVPGGPRPAAVLASIAAAAPQTSVSPVRAGAATVIVRVGPPGPAVPTGRGRRAAVLDVTLRDGVLLIGPLVQPAHSPCGRCLDLHRRDRDPAWPILASQLATGCSSADRCPLTTLLAGAAIATEEVLGYIDKRSWRTEGALLELRRPSEILRRSWPPHPRCDCHRYYRNCDGR